MFREEKDGLRDNPRVPQRLLNMYPPLLLCRLPSGAVDPGDSSPRGCGSGDTGSRGKSFSNYPERHELRQGDIVGSGAKTLYLEGKTAPERSSPCIRKQRTVAPQSFGDALGALGVAISSLYQLLAAGVR